MYYDRIYYVMYTRGGIDTERTFCRQGAGVNFGPKSSIPIVQLSKDRLLAVAPTVATRY